MMAAEAGEAGGRVGFYCRGNEWFCSTHLQSDIIVEVEGVLFHLHKFPLISKCGKIARLVEDAQNLKENMHHVLVGCPGGPQGFYIAARFCYETQVKLTQGNALLVFCTAEYLEMTEEYGGDNLLNVVQSFIHKTILRSWEDCILTLRGSLQFIPEAENLPVVQRCLDALSMMACTDPSLFGWPMLMYGSLQSPGGSILWNGINTGARIRSEVSNWWFEVVSCLSYPIFKKLMETMSKRGIRPENLAGALMYYARKYLPGLDRWQSGQGCKLRSIASLFMTPTAIDQKGLVEGIIKLLPDKKGKSYCRFLLGLLRLSILLDIEQSCKESLERIIGFQLEYATLDGLLVPNFLGSDNLYDTDCVERIIRHFSSTQKLNFTSFMPKSLDPAILPSSDHLNEVTKLINDYLAEVAPDVNLKPQKMWSLLEAFPGSSRTSDDGIYKAVDIYLKEHPWLPDDEREKLCSIINWANLSIDACTHATQNERLPMRRVFQVLFFEQMQLRSALSNCLHLFGNENNVNSTVNESAGEILQRDSLHQRVDMEHLQAKVRELEQEFVSIKQALGKVSRSRKARRVNVPQREDLYGSSDKTHALHGSRYARYGKIFSSNLLGREAIVSADAELNRFVQNKDVKQFMSALLPSFRGIFGGESLAFAAGEAHKRLRSTYIDFLSMKKLKTVFLDDANLLASAVVRSWKDGSIISAKDQSLKYSMQLMARSTLSIKEDDRLMEMLLRDYSHVVSALCSLPINFPGMKYWKALKARRNVLKIMKKIMAERINLTCKDFEVRKEEVEVEARESDYDLLDLLLMKRADYSDEVIEDFLFGSLFAGHDTTSRSIAFMLYLLADSPQVFQKLQEEHLQIVKSKSNLEPNLSWDDYRNLKFTNCVINETLRLSNAAAFIPKKAIEDIKYKGTSY